MKKGIKFYVFLLFFILSTFCVSVKTFADTQKQWVTLPTSVNQDGTTVNTQIYGYYTNIDNFGQVFVVCDPNTGQETGYAYIPNVKIGDAQTQEIVGYNDSKVLDWDNPKQIYPVSVSVIMPNVPTSVGWDLDYYNKTGILQRKTASTVTFPGSSSFVYKMPGSDPNYWLIVAQVTNPNSFPVTTHVTIELAGMYGVNGVSFDGTVSLGSNETKYVLLNNKDIGMLGSMHKGSYYTLLDYTASIKANNDPEYPGNDPNYSYINYFVPWNLSINAFGNSGNLVPQIPMRPTYYFDLSDISEFEDCSERELLDSREGYAIYNIETNQWDFVDMSLKQMDSKAVSYLRPLFARFGFSAPIILNWEYDKSGIVLSSDKYSSTKAFFNHLYPVPDPFIKGTTIKTSLSWYDELAGWYEAGSYSRGYELSGPVVVSYTGSECNYTYVDLRDDDVYVPIGTYIAKRNVDVRYYDTDWMKNLPVVEAEPIFIDQYKFVPVDGDNIGYLTKTTVPGYRLRVVTEDRPTINITTQPTEINVVYSNSEGNKAITKWTPSTGWQLIQNNIPSDEYNIQCQITIRYKQTVTGNNPNDFSVKWTNNSGNPPTLHWLSGNDVRNILVEMCTADFSYRYSITSYNTRSYRDTYLQNVSIAPSMKWGSFSSFEDALVNNRISYPEDNPEVVSNFKNGLQDLANQIGDMNLSLSDTLMLEANTTKTFGSFDKNITLSNEFSLYDVYAEDEYGNKYHADINDIITLVENTFNQYIIPKLSTTEEAAFVNGGNFYITPTFKAGSGGIISGAEEYFIGQHYQTYEDDGKLEREFVNAVSTPIGFPGAGVTLCSYITLSTPTNGWIMTPSDEYFSRIMTIQNVIPFYRNAPSGQQYWITYDPSTDSISPKPYPVW